jgi:hypothetical protein
MKPGERKRIHLAIDAELVRLKQGGYKVEHDIDDEDIWGATEDQAMGRFGNKVKEFIKSGNQITPVETGETSQED